MKRKAYNVYTKRKVSAGGASSQRSKRGSVPGCGNETREIAGRGLRLPTPPPPPTPPGCRESARCLRDDSTLFSLPSLPPLSLPTLSRAKASPPCGFQPSPSTTPPEQPPLFSIRFSTIPFIKHTRFSLSPNDLTFPFHSGCCPPLFFSHLKFRFHIFINRKQDT